LNFKIKVKNEKERSKFSVFEEFYNNENQKKKKIIKKRS